MIHACSACPSPNCTRDVQLHGKATDGEQMCQLSSRMGDLERHIHSQPQDTHTEPLTTDTNAEEQD